MSKATKKVVNPGSIIILLTGCYAGSRAVAIKDLGNSRIAVVGINAQKKVPLHSIEKSRVIVTSTKISVSALKGLTKLNNDMFSKANKLQLNMIDKEITKELEEQIKDDKMMQKYVSSKFCLNQTFRIPIHQLNF